MLKKIEILVLPLFVILASCAAKRNFTDPVQRVTRHTAYTLQKGEVRTGIGLFGQDQDNLGLDIELAVGYANWGHVSVNLAHAALGIVNLNNEFNIVDKEKFGLGVSLGFVWVKPTFIWFLPQEAKDEFGDLSVMSIPFEIETSYPIKKWLQLDFNLGFMWAGLFGEFGDKTALFGGGFGTRQIYVRTGIQFHLKEKVNLYVNSKLLVYGTLYGSAHAQFVVQEGLIVEAETVGWNQLDFMDGSNLSMGLEWKFREHFYMNLWLMYNGPFTRYATGGDNGLAGLEAKWRF